MASDFAPLQRGGVDRPWRAPKADLHIHGYSGADRPSVRERTGVDGMYASTAGRLSLAFFGVRGRALPLEATAMARSAR